MRKMKILIISDTHGRRDPLGSIIKAEKPFDLLLHCGDVEGDEEIIAQAAGCPAKFVAGNNDYFSDLPGETEFRIGRYKVWMTHGHHYYVSMNTVVLKQEARLKEADIVLYGHTHRPDIDIASDLIVINPGSLSYPRTPDRRPSYVIMELDENGEAHFTLKTY